MKTKKTKAHLTTTSEIAKNTRALYENIDNSNPYVFEIKDLNFYYHNGNKQALFNINLNIIRHRITAFIGPSGCGKSTLLRTLNRMNDLIEDTVVKGTITFNGQNIYESKKKIIALRRKVGMVFQKPNPFTKSIY